MVHDECCLIQSVIFHYLFHDVIIVSQASVLHSVSQLVALHIDSIVCFNIVVAILLPGGLFCTVNDLRK